MAKIDRSTGAALQVPADRKAEMITKLKASGVKIVERPKRQKPSKPSKTKRRNMVKLDGQWTRADGSKYGDG